MLTEEDFDPNPATREPPKKRKVLKSGKVRTADAMVLKQVTWPHELMYMASGQPAVYENLTIALFVSSYLAVIETIKSAVKPLMAKHLKELKWDAEVYG